MTKVGTAMTTRDSTSAVASNHPPLRIPAMSPTAMPATASKSSAMSESLMVTGYTSASFSMIGREPRRVTPRSRVNTPLRKSRYWTRKGLSRLYSARIWACTAGLRERSPPMAATGSPGRRKTMA